MKKSILIFLFTLLGVFSARAYDFEVDGIYYNILSGTTDKVEVTSSGDEASYTGSLVIPSTVTYGGTTYTVTSIGNGIFSGCSGLTSVTIPESVTAIGERTFRNCSGLTSVTMGESVDSIGNDAFRGCSGLRSVTIPESVTSIGYAAFCATSISNPLYNSKIFAYMPTDYSGEYEIPSGIQTIAGGAFWDCTGLTSVTIPNSVASVWGYAFWYCSGLTSIISMAENPPYYQNYQDYEDFDVFSDYSATLFVPRGSKEAYQRAEVWEKFTTIYEFGVDGTGLITVQPNDTTMGRVTGGGEYEIDKEITIEAIPNPGYHFVKWDDENTDNPRTLTVIADITLTAIFAQGDPTANENSEADNFGVYVQNRTIYLSENVGTVQVYNVAGQCVYNGISTAIPVRQGGLYIVKVGTRSYKVIVR